MAKAEDPLSCSASIEGSAPTCIPLYRDGAHLVVDSQCPVFPDICVKSGVPAKGCRFHFKAHFANRPGSVSGANIAGKGLSNLSPGFGILGPIAELAVSEL